MFCTNCGNQIADGSTFCPNCGTSLSAPAQQPQQPDYQQPAYQQPAYQQPVYQQPAYQQPAYQQPVYQQPAYQQPQQPAYQQPAYNGYAQPAFGSEDGPRKVDFGEAIKIGFKKYATFKGRASKSEFWWFYLLSFLVSMLLSWTFIAPLAMFIPMLAVAVRRLHDTGKSGWYYLMSLIPIAGGIIVIVQWCKDSVPADNEYGPGPQPAFNPYGAPYQPYQ